MAPPWAAGAISENDAVSVGGAVFRGGGQVPLVLVPKSTNELRVNSDKVQNVGQGQNLDHLRTPLI